MTWTRTSVAGTRAKALHLVPLVVQQIPSPVERPRANQSTLTLTAGSWGCGTLAGRGIDGVKAVLRLVVHGYFFVG
jgi:hypothetical protein